jgi:hypothetical protein
MFGASSPHNSVLPIYCSVCQSKHLRRHRVGGSEAVRVASICGGEPLQGFRAAYEHGVPWRARGSRVGYGALMLLV